MWTIIKNYVIFMIFCRFKGTVNDVYIFFINCSNWDYDIRDIGFQDIVNSGLWFFGIMIFGILTSGFWVSGFWVSGFWMPPYENFVAYIVSVKIHDIYYWNSWQLSLLLFIKFMVKAHFGSVKISPKHFW